jgi:hypothetical protein
LEARLTAPINQSLQTRVDSRKLSVALH